MSCSTRVRDDALVNAITTVQARRLNRALQVQKACEIAGVSELSFTIKIYDHDGNDYAFANVTGG
jgi:hypothetical protein